MLTSLHALLEQLAISNLDEICDTLDRVLPFVDRYRYLVDVQVTTHADWTKALFKLNYTLCSIVRTVAKDGFCQPKETEGEEGVGEQDCRESH